jgi:hypothetical protein
LTKVRKVRTIGNVRKLLTRKGNKMSAEMTIRCLAGDLLVEESLLVETIKNSPELTDAIYGLLNGVETYADLLELVCEYV